MLCKMKKTLTLLSLAMLLPALSASAGKVVTDSLQSAVLNARVMYNVYLPDGFDTSGKQYPVVYLLHGLRRGTCRLSRMNSSARAKPQRWSS